MVQVNVRVSAEVRKRAEEQLRLLDSSVGTLVRQVLDKATHSPEDCAELTKLVSAPKGKEASSRQSSLLRGWKIADGYCKSLDIEPGSAEDDVRTWDEVYQEAMDAHFSGCMPTLRMTSSWRPVGEPKQTSS